VIECLPWSDFLARYDSPTTLFYLDPPYWGSETDYGAGVFTRADFIRLAVRLAALRPLHSVGQRRSGNPRRLRALFDRERGHALHGRRRQVV
jgi:site-specific DNA-adenine methylase